MNSVLLALKFGLCVAVVALTSAAVAKSNPVISHNGWKKLADVIVINEVAQTQEYGELQIRSLSLVTAVTGYINGANLQEPRVVVKRNLLRLDSDYRFLNTSDLTDLHAICYGVYQLAEATSKIGQMHAKNEMIVDTKLFGKDTVVVYVKDFKHNQREVLSQLSCKR